MGNIDKKNIQNITDLEASLRRSTDIIVFDSDFKPDDVNNQPGYLDFFKYHPVSVSEYRIEKFQHPMELWPANKQWINNPVFSLFVSRICGGLVSVFMINPNKQSLLAFCRNTLIFSFMKAGAYSLDWPAEFSEGVKVLPFPVGYARNHRCPKLGMTGDLLRWSRYWKPCGAHEVACIAADIEVNEGFWKVYDKSNPTISEDATHEMLLAREANISSDDNYALIDSDDCGWPVAFGIRIGKGAVVVLPEGTNADAMLADMEEISLQTASKGFELVKAYTDSSRMLMIFDDLPCSEDGAFQFKSSDKINYKVIIDGQEKKVNVTVLCLFKFLIVWLASKIGIGIAFTTPDKLEALEKKKSGRGLKLAMLAVSKSQLKPLPGGELFHHITANISADITDIVNNAIFNKRDIGNEEWFKIYGHDKRKELTNVKGFSVRKVNGIRLMASSQFIAKLRKFKFDISDDKKTPRADCKEFNKNSTEFIELLISNIRRTNRRSD